MELPYLELLFLYPEVFSFKHLIKISLNYQDKKNKLKREWEKQTNINFSDLHEGSKYLKVQYKRGEDVFVKSSGCCIFSLPLFILCSADDDNLCVFPKQPICSLQCSRS